MYICRFKALHCQSLALCKSFTVFNFICNKDQVLSVPQTLNWYRNIYGTSGVRDCLFCIIMGSWPVFNGLKLWQTMEVALYCQHVSYTQVNQIFFCGSVYLMLWIVQQAYMQFFSLGMAPAKKKKTNVTSEVVTREYTIHLHKLIHGM